MFGGLLSIVKKYIFQFIDVKMRVKIYYRGVRKLCTNCFNQHLKIDCKNEKVKWIDYVKWLVSKNPEFSNEQYGRWIQNLEKEDKHQAIYRDHYSLPAFKIKCEKLIL